MRYKEGDIVRVKDKTKGKSFEKADELVKLKTGKSMTELDLIVGLVIKEMGIYGLRVKENGLPVGDFCDEDIIDLDIIEGSDF